MLDRFKEHLERSGLLRLGDRVLVGYSGGPDSTCLLSLLQESGIDVVGAHLHHGQRAEADDEAARCSAFCESLAIAFAQGKADVPQMARDLKIGLEEAGRKARYAFLEQAAAQLNCSLIATAHTRDDLVETMILNLARGTGIGGMAGIPARRGNVVRPLLPFSKAETRAFCESRDFWFHDDPANTDIQFSRARVRHRILPELSALNPGFLEAASRLATIAEDEDRFLNGAAAAALEQTETPLNGPLRFLTADCEVAFDRGKLLGLPAVLLKRALRLAADVLGSPLDFDQTNSLVQGIIEREKGSLTPEGGEMVAEWSGNEVHFRQLVQDEPFEFPLTVPGSTDSPVFGWTIQAMSCEPMEFQNDLGALAEVFDLDQVQGKLSFRSHQAGDTLQPIGFSGTKKLSDMLREAGLTLAARKRLPIILDNDGLVWVPGVALADRVKVTSATSRAVRASFGPLESS